MSTWICKNFLLTIATNNLCPEDFWMIAGSLSKVLFILYWYCSFYLFWALCVCSVTAVLSDSLWPHGLHGIFLAWILEWVAMPSSRVSSPVQGSNSHLLCLQHCRWILYHGATGKPLGLYYKAFKSTVILWKRHWCWERQEEKGTTEDEMVGWHHQLNGDVFEHTPGEGEGQGNLACCSPWGRKELDMTEWVDSNLLFGQVVAVEPACLLTFIALNTIYEYKMLWKNW